MDAAVSGPAIVRDEHCVRKGQQAIFAWIERANIAASAVAAPRAIRSAANEHEVTAEVSGAFPGSPVLLTLHFVIRDDQIAELAIA
ncbi:hypothetical protein ACSBM8_14090 [Sphingomonas sp. ASY06-1R]|uniref:hypothetical protein n=1 Tax=Sphingomonas sp. ASY06-1R TaxID=3445771 RepID=UPI003FA2746A